LEETKWESVIVVASAIKSLLLSQIKIIIHRHQQWSFVYWYKKRNEKMWKRNVNERLSWKMLSPLDWSNIYGSVLLVLNDQLICSKMGKEKIMLDNLSQKSHGSLFSVDQQFQTAVHGNTDCNPQNKFPRIMPFGKAHGKDVNSTRCPKIDFTSSDDCPSLDKSLDGYYNSRTGKFIPKYPITHNAVCVVDVPTKLDDSSHFGHVAWNYRNTLACSTRNS
jgi:hypothetical protein